MVFALQFVWLNCMAAVSSHELRRRDSWLCWALPLPPRTGLLLRYLWKRRKLLLEQTVCGKIQAWWDLWLFSPPCLSPTPTNCWSVRPSICLCLSVGPSMGFFCIFGCLMPFWFADQNLFSLQKQQCHQWYQTIQYTSPCSCAKHSGLTGNHVPGKTKHLELGAFNSNHCQTEISVNTLFPVQFSDFESVLPVFPGTDRNFWQKSSRTPGTSSIPRSQKAIENGVLGPLFS